MSKRNNFLVLFSLLSSVTLGVGAITSCQSNSDIPAPIEPEPEHEFYKVGAISDEFVDVDIASGSGLVGSEIVVKVKILNDQKVLDHFEPSDITFNKVDEETYTFVMPKKDVIVEAVLVDKKHEISLSEKAIQCGTTINKEDKVAIMNEEIIVNATDIPEGHKLLGFNVKDSTGKAVEVSKVDEGYKFLMPGSNAIIDIKLEAIEYNIETVINEVDKAEIGILVDDKVNTKATIGQTVEITTNILDTEWIIKKISYVAKIGETEQEVTINEKDGKYSFVMPACNVKINVTLAIKKATVAISGENLSKLSIKEIKEFKAGAEVNSITNVSDSFESVEGRTLRVYVSAKDTPARVTIDKMIFNGTEISATNGYFETTTLLATNTISFVTTDVEVYSVTVNNPTNLMSFAKIDGSRSAIETNYVEGQKVKFGIKNSNATEVFDLEKSGVFDDNGKLIVAFKDISTDKKVKEYETEEITIASDIVIEIVTTNKFLDKIYYVETTDINAAKLDMTIEVLPQSKLNINLNYYPYTTENLFNGATPYTTDEAGNIVFTVANTEFIFSISDTKISFKKGYISLYKADFGHSDGVVKALTKDFTSTKTDEADKLVVKKDGTASYKEISGTYEIKCELGEYTLFIGKEEFNIDLVNETFTYVEPQGPITTYFFTGKTFNSFVNNSNEEWGFYETYEVTITFAADKNEITRLVYKFNGNVELDERNIPFTVAQNSNENILDLTLDIRGNLCELSAYKSSSQLRFSKAIVVDGKTYAVNSVVYLKEQK